MSGTAAEASAWGGVQHPTVLEARGRRVTWPRRPLIAGIVNINGDSFSGDGTLDIDEALGSARRMVLAGADIIDVGGESARTNREAIGVDDEIRRVRPLIERFGEALEGAIPRDETQVFPPLLSVSTRRPEVADALLECGGHLLNDIGALPDNRHAHICARNSAALVIMHREGEPKLDHPHVRYADVVAEVTRFFGDRMQMARAAGVQAESIVLDPGIDFAKPCDDSLRLLRELGVLVRLGRPVLVPLSRKRLVSDALGGRAANEIDAGTAGLVVSCALRGASLMRVHNVEIAWTSLRMVEAVLGEKEPQ